MVEDPAGYGTDEHKPKSKRPFLIASGFPMRQFWLVFQGFCRGCGYRLGAIVTLSPP